MPLDTDNSIPTIAWNNRQIPIVSPLRLTPGPNENASQAKAQGKRSGIDSREDSELSWRTPGCSQIECLLLMLNPRFTQEDFPIAIQFVTHGFRTTVIFERSGGNS